MTRTSPLPESGEAASRRVPGGGLPARGLAGGTSAGDTRAGDTPAGDAWRAFLRSFWFAGQGVWHVIRTQRNMRVHLAAAACAIAAGVALRISPTDWACVIGVIGLVLTAEALNTVVEAIVDLATAEFHPLAKVAKDAAAGAVLISSAAAVGVAVAVFLPRLLSLAG